MGLFKKRKFKQIEKDSQMMKRYPTFYEYYERNKGLIQAELSASDDNFLEFHFPILTYGNIMGYIHFGIEEKSKDVHIYMYAVSRSGGKTKIYRIKIDSDASFERYGELEYELSANMFKDPDFRKISIGGYL